MLNKNNELKLVSLTYNDNGRFLIYHFHNTNLKNNKDVLLALYTSLMNDDKFKNFGFNKIIITSGVINNREYSYHHNVLLTNNTTFEQYYNQVISFIDHHYD